MAAEITYRDSLAGITPEHLQGFFVGWADPPSPDAHLRLLAGSDAIVLAVDELAGSVVGFVTAISDGVLSAYVPLLEVLPSHQNRGIGSELMRRLLRSLRDLYMVDLLCDPQLQPFYRRFGMLPATAMALRSPGHQSGRPAPR